MVGHIPPILLACCRGNAQRSVGTWIASSGLVPNTSGAVMIRTILVPLDGSAFGEQAVAWAALVAARAGAELHLVHVLEPLIVGDPMMQYTMVDVETPEEARDYVTELLRRHPEAATAKAPVTAV